MSLPNPMYVSPSTTIVQVNPLQNPYTPVLLNSVVYPGQVVTILDTTSSLGALTTPIVVSTQTQSFQDGTISTLINQPQGFITAQSLANSNWTFLNSFPFRNQTLSAGVLNLTTSSIFTALASTVQETVSSLTVQNLNITGDFVQAKGLQLNTSLSSFGAVIFGSSVTVLGNVYISSVFSTIGNVSMNSSLTVFGNMTVSSPIQTTSSVFVSSFLQSLGSLSTGSIVFQDGLVGTTLEVQQSTLYSMDVAGSIEVGGSLFTLGPINIGGFLQAKTLVAQNALFLSSMSLSQSAYVSSFVSVSNDLSVLDAVTIGGPLTIGYDASIYSTLQANKDGYIQETLTIGSTLTASTLSLDLLQTNGDYANQSTITYLSSGAIQGNYGGGSLTAKSIRVGTFETASDLSITSSVTVSTFFEVTGPISSLSYVQVGRANASIEGSLSVHKNLYMGGDLIDGGNLTMLGDTRVLGSTLADIQSGFITYIFGDLAVHGNLRVEDTLTLSSIVLPSSFLANTFTVDSLFVGSEAIVKNALLSTVIASTVTVGYIDQTDVAFDLSGSLLIQSLSTNLFSTTSYRVKDVQPAALYIQRGMGIQVEPEPDLFLCQPIAYFLSSPVYVFSTLSAQTIVIEAPIEGTFIGDASQLSNFNYPRNLSSYDLYISSQLLLNVDEPSQLNMSTLVTSTFNAYNLTALSSLQVGSLSIWGNASAIEYLEGVNLLQTDPAQNLLLLNNVKLYGQESSRRVAINEDLAGDTFTATLGVHDSIAVNTIQTDALLTIDTYNAQTVIASSIYGFGGSSIELFSGYGGVYLSSGVISTTTGKFFLREGEPYDSHFNTVQPYQSTLQFNSTLFVNRELSSIGINTQPNFNLDVQKVFGDAITYGGPTSVINQLNISKSFSTQAYAFIQPDVAYSNTIYSSNFMTWKNPQELFYPLYSSGGVDQIYVGYFSPGLSRQTSVSLHPEQRQTEYFFGSATYPSGSNYGLLVIPIAINNIVAAQLLTLASGSYPNTIRAMATDGYRYVFTGTNNPDISPAGSPIWVGPTAFNDPNGPVTTFDVADTGMTSFGTIPGRPDGGYDVVYGGTKAPVWIVVGAGSTASAFRSDDGVTWTSNDRTGYEELRSIIYVEFPNTGDPTFLATGGTLSKNMIFDGAVVQTNNGTIWTTVSGTLFRGSGLTLATNGPMVIVGGEDNRGYTLYYSILSNSPVSSWTLCSGSLFPERTNKVIWTGTTWLAAGDSGIRQSYDGITWFNPTTLSMEIFGLGYTSNADTTLQIGSSTSNFLNFQDSPNLQCQRFFSAPTISYYSNSIMNINNACILDTQQNIIVPGLLQVVSPLSNTSFVSTFYSPEAYISSTLSTNQLRVGGYFVGVETF